MGLRDPQINSDRPENFVGFYSGIVQCDETGAVEIQTLFANIIRRTGCPTKKLTFLKPVYLRPLISFRKSSVLEMNLWIFSFRDTKSKFSRILGLRDIKGIRYYSCCFFRIKLT